jgi:hypothetical protein
MIYVKTIDVIQVLSSAVFLVLESIRHFNVHASAGFQEPHNIVKIVKINKMLKDMTKNNEIEF